MSETNFSKRNIQISIKKFFEFYQEKKTESSLWLEDQKEIDSIVAEYRNKNWQFILYTINQQKLIFLLTMKSLKNRKDFSIEEPFQAKIKTYSIFRNQEI
ncbi:MAG: hypothetical protein Ta2E_13290 [Mycoplasmoidaceae bacterium]|nr:MAG: hypothetical protein Ta2E_13290 [Mycoplasmoidaceae bacterium]